MHELINFIKTKVEYSEHFVNVNKIIAMAAYEQYGIMHIAHINCFSLKVFKQFRNNYPRSEIRLIVSYEDNEDIDIDIDIYTIPTAS